jgi:hypothetical protein
MASEQQVIRREQQSIRRSIKATIAQLDHWDNDQRELERRRTTANANYPNGVLDRKTLAQHRARVSQGTLDLLDPPCTLCSSRKHLTDECHLETRDGQVVTREESSLEDPANGIHRAIVHRLHSHACDLYHLLYPRFYPGAQETQKVTLEETQPVPQTGPDYLVLGHPANDLFSLLNIE